MTRPLRKWLRSITRRRRTLATRPVRQLLKGFERFGIDVVLDVGANVGQFAGEIRTMGYTGRIVSFEPLSQAHLQLTAAAKGDAAWSIHPRCAIGNYDGTVEINVAGNSVSSSILPMTKAHTMTATNSGYVGSEPAPIYRLDTVVAPYLGAQSGPFLKIDTQGFEWHVLEGATRTLPALRGILCELSLVALYDGQHLWLEVLDRLRDDGFTLWNLQPGFADPRDGRTLQVDATFYRV